ncbi:MAG: DUF3450 domain-containing protein [Candidatus Binatia bacterium]|nr:DUF3450 domain-containing protein [Candidatus Binatia bacterium]
MRLVRRTDAGDGPWRARLWRAALVVALCGAVGWSAGAQAQSVKDAIGASEGTNKEAQASQKKIDAISDDTDALAAEYRAAIQEIKALRGYNKQLEGLIVSQGQEMESLRGQIDNVTVVGRQVMPLMSRMLDSLDQFVALDVPFLPEERAERIANMKEMMGRADVTISEKYRRILEGYQVENEYGRTIEAYRGPVTVDGEEISVDFLRIGRLSLLYQTLDGQQSGMWDNESKTWVPLDDEYRNAIKAGLRMARKQSAPDLIKVPVPAAQAAEVNG